MSSQYAQPVTGVPSALQVTIAFTVIPQDSRPIRAAAALVADLNARIRLLFIEVVPFPLPAHEPAIDQEWTLQKLRRLAESIDLDAELQVVLCRDVRQALIEHTKEGAVVLA